MIIPQLARIEKACSRTKMIIINNPHNPTGKADFDALESSY
jgi:aspartate/methionine/tyrosine aminotransferase